MRLIEILYTAAALAAVLPFPRGSQRGAPRIEPLLELKGRALPPPDPPGRPVPKRAPAAPPLKPRAAAKGFVEWMQAHGFVGLFPFRGSRQDALGGSDGLWDYYLLYCHELNVRPTPLNTFCEALDRIIDREVIRDRSTGRLRRLTYYRVPDLIEVEMPPPRRRV